MFYPDHQIRTYCIYLGSFELADQKYDMGVYIAEDKSVSHAIVFGNDPSEYLSGKFMTDLVIEIFYPDPCLYKMNEALYKHYLNYPADFPQPNKE
jgi:hypothetical protein